MNASLKEYKHAIFPGPHGWIGLVGSNNGLCRLSMKPTPEEILEDLNDDLRGSEQDDTAFPQARECLERYFAGDTQALNEIVLDLSDAPPFFGAAWEACRSIPARGNPKLLLAGRRSRPAQRGPRRRPGHGPQSPGPGHPLPPGHRQQRRPPRLRRRRPGGQGPPPPTGTGTATPVPGRSVVVCR